MRNAGLDEAQSGIKIARRNINNLRYADNNTLMAKSEEKLKSLLMKVKEERSEERRVGKVWGKMEAVTDIIFLGSKITVDSDCSHEIKRHLLLGGKAMTNLDSV